MQSIENITEAELATVPREQAVAIEAYQAFPKYEAAASYLNIPLGTLKSRINRGREKIGKARAMAVAAEQSAQSEAA